MPLSASPRLGLIRNQGTDPFKRQDFIDNWGKLDAQPGVLPCTSLTRPAWTSVQAGELIQETDTGRLLAWTGSAWILAGSSSRTFIYAANTNANQNANTIVQYSVGSITLTRDGTIFFTATTQMENDAGSQMHATADILIAGVAVGSGGPVQCSWHSATAGNMTDSATIVGSVAKTAGTYAITSRVLNQSGTGPYPGANQITVKGTRLLAIVQDS